MRAIIVSTVVEAVFLVDVRERPDYAEFKFYAPEEWLWTKEGLSHLWDSAQEALEAEYETLAVELLCVVSINQVKDCRVLWPDDFLRRRETVPTDSQPEPQDAEK